MLGCDFIQLREKPRRSRRGWIAREVQSLSVTSERCSLLFDVLLDHANRAPPRLLAKYEGDHSALSHSLFLILG